MVWWVSIQQTLLVATDHLQCQSQCHLHLDVDDFHTNKKLSVRKISCQSAEAVIEPVMQRCGSKVIADELVTRYKHDSFTVLIEVKSDKLESSTESVCWIFMIWMSSLFTVEFQIKRERINEQCQMSKIMDRLCSKTQESEQEDLTRTEQYNALDKLTEKTLLRNHH